MNKEKLIAKIDEEKQVINKDDTWETKIVKAEFNRALLIAKKIIQSEPEETCENCNYWEREAKKWCSQLSELRYKIKLISARNVTSKLRFSGGRQNG